MSEMSEIYEILLGDVGNVGDDVGNVGDDVGNVGDDVGNVGNDVRSRKCTPVQGPDTLTPLFHALSGHRTICIWIKYAYVQ
jgi:hypothetical protein